MRKILVFCFLFLVILGSCKKDRPLSYLSDHKYPKEIRDIFLTKCATSGCHNTKSKDGADGLDLSTWDKLFEGGKNGSSVIPFRPDQSFLLFFVNTYPGFGISLLPTMPLNGQVLSKDEVQTISTWILNGAPDSSGFVKFSDGGNIRKKIYVTNQGCDLVAVYDAETKLIMRYVNVGVDNSQIESPHMVRVSPDGKYWYVVFYNGHVLQRFNTSDDSPAGVAEITHGQWNTVAITSDSKKAVCVDWEPNGKIAIVDLETMTAGSILNAGLFSDIHGSAFGPSNDTVYITKQTGNFIYKIPLDSPGDLEEIILETGKPKNQLSSLDPHEIVFSPDKKKYFVACQHSNEVRILQTSNDSLLATIGVGDFPQEIALSTSSGYLFVSCMDDTTFNKSGMGSVAIIDYKTNSLVKQISAGIYQPHGIAVDDDNKVVYVANRNLNTTGPAPHHSSTCGGRNGFVSLIDMNTLDLFHSPSGNIYKSEVSVDPFSVAVRK